MMNAERVGAVIAAPFTGLMALGKVVKPFNTEVDSGRGYFLLVRRWARILGEDRPLDV